MSRVPFALLLVLATAGGAALGRAGHPSPAGATEPMRAPDYAALAKTTKDLQDRLIKLESRTPTTLPAAADNSVSMEAFNKQSLRITQLQHAVDALVTRMTAVENVPHGGGSNNGDQALLGVNGLIDDVHSLKTQVLTLKTQSATIDARVTSTQDAIKTHTHCLDHHIGIIQAVISDPNTSSTKFYPVLSHSGTAELTTEEPGGAQCKAVLAPMK